MDMQTQAQIDSWNSQIRHKRNQIDDLTDDISELRKKLKNAEEALQQHRTAAEKFNDDNENNLQSVKTIAAMEHIKLAQRYSQALSETISGQKSKNAMDAVNKIGTDINNEIAQLEEEIATKEQQIYSLQNQILSLKSQISSLQ